MDETLRVLRRKSCPKAILVFFLCFSMGSLRAAPTPTDVTGMSGILKPTDGSLNFPKGSVYIYGDQSMDTLMPVKIIGAVAKAGIHYVPYDTDLITLISLAGGTTKEAELNSVVIKRQNGKKNEILTADLEHLVNSDAGPIQLSPNDTVLIQSEKVTLSENTMRWVTVASVAASVLSSVAVILAVTRK